MVYYMLSYLLTFIIPSHACLSVLNNDRRSAFQPAFQSPDGQGFTYLFMFLFVYDLAYEEGFVKHSLQHGSLDVAYLDTRQILITNYSNITSLAYAWF